MRLRYDRHKTHTRLLHASPSLFTHHLTAHVMNQSSQHLHSKFTTQSLPGVYISRLQSTQKLLISQQFLLLWFKHAMSGQQLTNHEMAHILICPVRQMTRDTREEGNVKSLAHR
jgi:hypothetical protein